MICRSLDKFIVISIEQGASYTAATRHLHFFIERDTVYACRISSADLARIAIRKKSRWRLWVTIIGLIHTPLARPTIMVSTFTLRMAPGLRPNMLSLRMTMSASLPGVMHPFSFS